jgi:hypothetical protein
VDATGKGGSTWESISGGRGSRVGLSGPKPVVGDTPAGARALQLFWESWRDRAGCRKHGPQWGLGVRDSELESKAKTSF